MRRKDKEIQDRELVSQVIKSCQVCRLGLARDDVPYIVPVSFGYDGQAIYFHTAREGKKLDYIAANNAVCFEFEHGVQVVPHDSDPCKWSFSFQSVIGNGRIHELVAREDKIEGLNHVMRQYSGREWAFGDKTLDAVRVWKITIETISGKQTADKAGQAEGA
jgi:nitroimidazol reductase NimA-like FMN-containing flavoprotein (pyridoxamine 5'-phosphate oxidase superfamily)